jgi:EpsD family peptidyl-prolyl cis-trans isomerase
LEIKSALNISWAKAFAVVAIAGVIPLTLEGCKIPGFGGGAPTGQVVATVGGHEVTTREVDAELAGAKLTDPKARKAAEQTVLSNILARKILAQAAIDQGLDKTPAFPVQKQRVIDSLLVQMLESKIASQVPPATREDAQSFVADHPDIFAQRKVFALNQIRMAKPKDQATLKAMEPLKTMDEVEARLDAEKIPYQKGTSSLDAVGADPKMIDEIVKLPPDEIFIVPSGNGLLVNQIIGTKIVPFTGDPALQYAQALINRQRASDAVSRQLQMIVGKSAHEIRYNKDFQPPAAVPPAAKPAAPANE